MRRTILALLCLQACGTEEPEPRVTVNTPPQASLRVPVLAPVDPVSPVPVRLDAEASFDPDADPLTYVFEIAGPVIESISTASPTIDFVFPSEGTYVITVRVTDIHEAESAARHEVAARLDFPADPAFCDDNSPCVVGDECDAGQCYSTGGALD